jgi:hypothetical protein
LARIPTPESTPFLVWTIFGKHWTMS